MAGANVDLQDAAEVSSIRVFAVFGLRVRAGKVQCGDQVTGAGLVAVGDRVVSGAASRGVLGPGDGAFALGQVAGDSLRAANQPIGNRITACGIG